MVFKTDYHLMQVESIAECFRGSILQYFRPSLSYHLSLRSLFYLLLSVPLRQVLLYSLDVANIFVFKEHRNKATLFTLVEYFVNLKCNPPHPTNNFF